MYMRPQEFFRKNISEGGKMFKLIALIITKVLKTKTEPLKVSMFYGHFLVVA